MSPSLPRSNSGSGDGNLWRITASKPGSLSDPWVHPCLHSEVRFGTQAWGSIISTKQWAQIVITFAPGTNYDVKE